MLRYLKTCNGASAESLCREMNAHSEMRLISEICGGSSLSAEWKPSHLFSIEWIRTSPLSLSSQLGLGQRSKDTDGEWGRLTGPHWDAARTEGSQMGPKGEAVEIETEDFPHDSSREGVLECSSHSLSDTTCSSHLIIL